MTMLHDQADTPTASAAAEPQPTPAVVPQATSADELIEDELLVEEISIDGMCGVY